jgi:folate-dependent phosphoribosylglycinamide formyltransferase PurN
MTQKLVLYVGLDPKTLFLLEQDKRFSVVAVGDIPELIYKGINPVNLLLYLTYILRKKDYLRYLEISLLFLCRLFSPLSTGVFKRYSKYILLVITKGYKVIDVYDSLEAIKRIKLNHIDVCVINSWGMLNKDVVDAPVMGTINIHPSELPKYRGALPTLWSLKNQDKESAVSYIIANAKADQGMLIGQHKFSIDSNDDALSMEKKISSVISQTFLDDLAGYLAGNTQPWSQDESISSSTGKYEQYRLIDLINEKALDIYNKIKLYPYLEYGTYCYLLLDQKRKIFVKNVSFTDSDHIRDVKIIRDHLNIYLNAVDGRLKARLFLDFSIIDSFRLLFCKK